MTRLNLPRRRRGLDDRCCAAIPNAQRVIGHRFAVLRRAPYSGRDMIEQLLRSGHFGLRKRAMRHSLPLSSTCSSATMADGAALSRRGPGSRGAA